MTRRVLDVGNCDLDHGSLSDLLRRNFDVTIVRCHSANQALKELATAAADLVLINRVFDRDQSDGIDLIRRIKADAELKANPCMLITNFPEHQAAAIAVGGEPGFGKRGLHDPTTAELLAKYLKA